MADESRLGTATSSLDLEQPRAIGPHEPATLCQTARLAAKAEEIESNLVLGSAEVSEIAHIALVGLASL